LLRGFITGLIPFPLFFYALAAGLPFAHPALVFSVALGAVISAHFLVIFALRRRARS
jgi:hypothetical protein